MALSAEGLQVVCVERVASIGEALHMICVESGAVIPAAPAAHAPVPVAALDLFGDPAPLRRRPRISPSSSHVGTLPPAQLRVVDGREIVES